MTNRRHFLASTMTASAIAMAYQSTAIAADRQPRFELDFAPHPGMFRSLAGDDVLDQIRYAHDQGFTAWEHNSMPSEPPELQAKIGTLLRDLGMRMGVFVGYGDFERPTFAVQKETYREEVLEKIRQSIDVAKRCGATHLTVVPGTVDQQSASDENWNRYGGGRLAAGYQFANVIDLLRQCAEILEPHDLTMVLEPLNWKSITVACSYNARTKRLRSAEPWTAQRAKSSLTSITNKLPKET
jgi:hydroxypyruvate isomerase